MPSDDEWLDFQARMRRLESLEEIRRLRYKYHKHINDGEFEMVADLFTLEGVIELDYLSTWRGRKEIYQGITSIPDRTPLLKQFVHNHVVDLGAAGATGYSYFEARYARDGASLMVAGKYDDVYARVEGVWLIESMVSTIYFAVPVQKGWAGADLHYLRPGREAEE